MTDNLRILLNDLKSLGKSQDDTCRRSSKNICGCSTCRKALDLADKKIKDETETSGDNTGNSTDATTASPFNQNSFSSTLAKDSIAFDGASFRRFSLFSTDSNKETFFFNSDSPRKNSFHLALKKELTPEEEELLRQVLNILNLDAKDFRNELNVPLKSFLREIKAKVLNLGLPTPQQNPELFVKHLKESKLFSQKMLEKLHKLELDQNPEPNHPQPNTPFRLTPYSTQLRRR